MRHDDDFGDGSLCLEDCGGLLCLEVSRSLDTLLPLNHLLLYTSMTRCHGPECPRRCEHFFVLHLQDSMIGFGQVLTGLIISIRGSLSSFYPP